MKKQRGFTLVEGGSIVVLLLWAAFAIGWIMNIVKFIGMLGGDVNSWFIARAVGIFLAPLGGVLGFF